MWSFGVHIFLINLCTIIFSLVYNSYAYFHWRINNPSPFNLETFINHLGLILISLILTSVIFHDKYTKTIRNLSLYKIFFNQIIQHFLLIIILNALMDFFHLYLYSKSTFYTSFYLLNVTISISILIFVRFILRRKFYNSTTRSIIITNYNHPKETLSELFKLHADNTKVLSIIKTNNKSDELYLYRQKDDKLIYSKQNPLTYLKRQNPNYLLCFSKNGKTDAFLPYISTASSINCKTLFATSTLDNYEISHSFNDSTTKTSVRTKKHIYPKTIFIYKRFYDIIFSIIGLIITAVFTIIISPFIYFEDPGPIFKKYRRYTRTGKIFYQYKFRTTYINPTHKPLLGDHLKNPYLPNNLTFFGKILYKTFLYELPGLLNVLKGEMSIVGGKPLTLTEYKKIKQHKIPKQTIENLKHLKPGLTGVWQHSRSSNYTLQKLTRLNYFYLDHWSPYYDFYIIYRTFILSATPEKNSLLYVSYQKSIFFYIERLIYYSIKRFFDIICALIGSIFLLPTAIIVKISYILTGDYNPILYRQKRIGKNGKPIYIYKFRSMVSNADEALEKLLQDPIYREEWDKNQKFENDPRITKIGHFIRKTSLDELPQFINVLKGDMSIIGPRPLVEGELLAHKGDRIIYESVKPGISGWWAANGRSALSYQKRLELEYFYCNHCSLILDIKCVLLTINAVFLKKGAK